MNIGILTDGMYPYDQGGHQIRIHELATRYAEDHEVDVYVQEKPGVSYPDEHEGVSIISVSAPVPSERIRLTVGGLRYARRVPQAVAAADASYDVIDISFAADTAKIDAPTVATYGAFLQRWHEISGYIEKIKNAMPVGIQYYLNRKTLAGADYAVALSGCSREEMEDLFDPTCPVRTIKNGVDANHFIPDGPGADLPGLGEYVGMYAGRLHEEKGVFELLEAVSHSDIDIDLVFVGDGPAEKGLRKRVREANLENRVSFAGFVDYEEIPQYYRAADVCFLPSYFEIQPLSCIEAMACGTPIIASDIAGMREIVTDKQTGLLTPSERVDPLTDAIQQLFESDRLYTHLVENGLSFANTRTWDDIATETLSVYAMLTKDGPTTELGFQVKE
jgi:glycosyltransferase involved in cell wall biosynthesis